MADTAVAITAGTGTNIDTRTEGTNGNHRQVVVLGDPATNAGVAPVDATAGLKVDLGADNDITGTVTANLSATDNAVLDQIELNQDSQTAILTTIDSDTGGILADTAAIQTAVELLDDTVYVDDADWSDGSSKHLLVGGLYQSTPQTVTDGDVAPFNITTNGALHVAQQGTVTVDLGSNNDVTVTSGTITANLGAVDNAVLDSIVVDTGEIQTAVEAIQTAVEGTLTVTGGGGGTEYTEDVATDNPIVGKAIMVERDDALSTVTPIEGDNIGLRGTAEGALWTQDFNSDAILADTANMDTNLGTIAGAVSGSQMQVDIVADGADLLTNTNFAAAFGTAGTADAQVMSIQGIASMTPVIVDLGANNDVTVTGTVTANLSATDNAVLDQIELNTDPLLVVGGGTEATAQRVTIANDSTGVVSIDDNGGAITVDGSLTSAGNVTNAGTFAVQVDGAALTALQLIDNSIYVDDADWTADTSSHTLVGAVTQVATTANTDGDVTPLTTNAFRELRVAYPESDLATATTAHTSKYYANTGAVTDGIVWSPAAGKRWYLTALHFTTSAAATVTLEDDRSGGDTVMFAGDYAANSGVGISFPTPLFSGEDAADLIVTTTAGNIKITAVGYEI